MIDPAFPFEEAANVCLPAGIEKARVSLWGHPAVKDLGSVFLPQLKDGDLYVAPSELDGFERECRQLLLHAAAIAAATGYGQGGATVDTSGGHIFVGAVDDSIPTERIQPGDTGPGKALIDGYLRNMLHACSIARACGGTVYIG